MAVIPGVYQAKNAVSDDSRQGSKFNSIVNAIVNPANTSLLTGFDPVIEEVSNPNAGTVVTYMPHTVSGTPPLALPNSAGQPLQAWSVEVGPYQEGTGDPSPDNVRTIHGTDKVTITTAGKNLFSIADVDYSLNGVRFVSENNVITVTGTALSGYYPNQRWNFTSQYPAGQYTLSANETSRGDRLIRIWFSNNTFAAINGALPYTFTAPADVVAFQYACNSGSTYDDVLSDIQLELGSTATPYTPYLAPSTTVLTLPQTVYAGTIGSEGGESRSAEVDMGDLDWVYNTPKSTFYALVTGKAYGEQDKIMCEQYKASITTGFNLSDYEISVGSNNSYVYVKDPRYTTVSDFKTAVSGVKLVYPLATPTTFAVPSTTIPTPAGTATTWAMAVDGTVESMEITYLENT